METGGGKKFEERGRSVRDTDGGNRQDGERIDPDELEDRLAWFFETRADSEGTPLYGLFARAAATRRRMELEEAGDDQPAPPGGPGSVNWTPIGPSVVAHGQATSNPAVSGRVTAVVVGPGGSRVYAGGANGGVWFSGDGGGTWSPLGDYLASPAPSGAAEADSLSVGAIAVRFGASAATDEVFVGTGEPNASADAYFGIGVRHSSGGGAPGTWSLEATNLAGRAVYAITIDPDDPTVVHAATTVGLFRRPAAGSMATWTQVTSPSFTNAGSAVSALIVAGIGAAKRYYAAFAGDQVYSSPDAVTWTAVPGLTGSGRIALAAGESDPTVVYALRQSGNLLRLAGGSFQSVTGLPAGALFFGGQGWYDIAIGVDPANANTVYLVGDLTWDGSNWSLAFFKGTITGGPGSFTFPFNAANVNNPAADPTWIGRNIHADGHAFAFALNAAGTAHDPTNVWVGTDGGLFQSTAGGAAGTFQAHNTGLAITEPTFLAQRADTDAVLFSGTQDNGTVRYFGEQAWYEAPQGDGGGITFDPNDPYRIMRQYVRAGRFQGGTFLGALSRSTDGGASGSWSTLTFPPFTSTSAAQQAAVNAENGQTGFYAPIKASPPGVSPTLAAFGTHRLWLTADWGTSWVTLPTATNPYATATPNATQDSIDGSPVRAIAFASGTRIFAATTSTIWRYDKGATWSATPISTAGLPPGFLITALAVHDPVAGSFYATLGGGGVAHLYYYDGAAWHVAMPASVIDIPTHAVVVDPAHPEVVYVGTDVGCWRGTKTGPTTWSWALFSQGLPEAAIVDLAIHGPARLLRAATHGRGVWEIQLDAASGQDPDLYLRVNYADAGRLDAGSRHPWVEGAADPTRQGFAVYHWMSADIKVRRGSLSGLPALSSPVDYLDFATNIGDYVDSTTDTETADIGGSNRIFVQVHNRSLTPIPAAQVRVLLLVTDAAAGLPALPPNYATHINAGDTSTAWLAGTAWWFADPATPYRTPPRDLDVRIPQVVEWTVDFSSLSLPAGHDHVCAAAFVTTTTAADQITAVTPSMDELTMHDKHAVHRNLHLVIAGARPSPQGRVWLQEPQTVLLDFHNPLEQDTVADLVFERQGFVGQLALTLPKLHFATSPEDALKGWRLTGHGGLSRLLGGHLGRLLERVGEFVEDLGEDVERLGERLEGLALPPDERELRIRKLADLDRSLVYMADDSPVPTISGVLLPAGDRITAAITLQAPDDAKPGDRYRLNVIQRGPQGIVGGSSYVLAVARATNEEP